LRVNSSNDTGYREVLPGVFLIALPLPFTLGSINVYLVQLTSGYLLVDCGMDTDECFEALWLAVAAQGVAWHDIHEILLTHVHPDHMGLAPRLLKLTGARLLLHSRDTEYLEVLAQSERYLAWAGEVLHRAGVAADLISKIETGATEIHKSFQRLQPDRLLAGGERILAAVGELEVLWTPGHSPGHVCLYGREHRVLFSGDQMLELISPNIGWLPERDPLSEYLNSLQDLARLDIDLILPSHGGPFSGHREWIRRTVEHHEERCNRILALLTEGPKNAAALVDQLWDRHLEPFHYRFAVFEVLAHLEYLERQKRVMQRAQDGVAWWHAG
jgi:glyoxylase-like metal-dependent hydrolase (beta-lactamase superfamily II)